MSKTRIGALVLAASVAAVACNKEKAADDDVPIRPLPASPATAATGAPTAAAAASAAPTAASTATTVAASPFPPDPDCAEGRPPIGPRFGPVRKMAPGAVCQPGDACGYFLLVATAQGCGDGGDGAGSYVETKLRDHGFSDGQVVVFIDRNGRRGAGAMFASDERKQDFTHALDKQPDRLFPNYVVYRPLPPPQAAAPSGGEPDQTLRALKGARASSQLSSNPPDRAFDKDEQTAWCEGKPGDGTGEWIEAEIEPGFTVSAVEVTGGWAFNSPTAARIRGDSGDMWELSHVVSKLRVEWDGGSDVVTFERASDRGVHKRVAIGKATGKVRFVIERVSKGAGGDNGRWSEMAFADVWSNRPSCCVPLLLAAALLAACDRGGGSSEGGCTRDTDCKDDRVCESGQCVEARGGSARPGAAAGTAGTAAARTTAAATATGAAAAAGSAADAVAVPGGTFTMGCAPSDKQCMDDEKPTHAVTVTGFSLDRTEVTVAAYRRCVEAGGCTAAHAGKGCNGAAADKDAHPINCVTWEQARAYCKWAGRRLPTEAEWEMAARGGDGRIFPWGADHPAERVCWKRLLSEGTCPVGAYPNGASPAGALDMAGNVGEWVADWYDTVGYTAAAATDPAGPGQSTGMKVFRGGDWSVAGGRWIRTSKRGAEKPESRSAKIGLRCVR
ncbi:MAG: SUMF1/EgtB/PvdO family nonheme iron enzyme [Deltaproteobacteria bacterium]|nr:SUMF1/EgtB/PvdO family nonheme iron enzyme [Deltaproteobacteria bacterium]